MLTFNREKGYSDIVSWFYVEYCYINILSKY